MFKFTKNTITGEYVKIDSEDRDFDTTFALTEEELITEFNSIARALKQPQIIRKSQQKAWDDVINAFKVKQGIKEES